MKRLFIFALLFAVLAFIPISTGTVTQPAQTKNHQYPYYKSPNNKVIPKSQPHVQNPKPQHVVHYPKPQPAVHYPKPQPAVHHPKPQPNVHYQKPHYPVNHNQNTHYPKPQPNIHHPNNYPHHINSQGPHIHHPNGPRPDVHHPNGPRPDTHHLHGPRPDIHHPNGPRPDIHHPNGPRPDTHHLHGPKPDIHHSHDQKPDTHHTKPDDHKPKSDNHLPKSDKPQSNDHGPQNGPGPQPKDQPGPQPQTDNKPPQPQDSANGSPCKVPPTRQGIVDAAMWAHSSGKYINYSQGGSRWSGISQKTCPYQGVPHITDCSAFVTWLYWSAFGNGKDFVNGQDWKAGYTGSMGSHGTPVSLAQARPGDVVLYGSHPYHHATLYVGNNKVISFGANGPAKLLPINYRGDYHIRSYLP